MCLAVPGKIVECRGEEAVVSLQGNRLKISIILTPQAAVGNWVLVHAGFAIAIIDERDALETWDYLRAAIGTPLESFGDEAAAHSGVRKTP
jgi:hydrogenase expression/formation protein HypC